MSGVLAPIAIVSAPMAEQFGLAQTDMTSRFSWLTIGTLIGSGAAVVLLNEVRLRTAMVFLYGLIALALGSLGFAHSVIVIQVIFGAVGVACGIGLAVAAAAISRTYDSRARGSVLVITDSFFSIAGFICAGLAAFLVQQALAWSWVYVFVGLIALGVVVLALVTDFPEVTELETSAREPMSSWPWSAWCALVALCFYTLGQSCLLLWLPQFAELSYGLSPGEAGSLVAQFWLGMCIGQIVAAFVVLAVGVRTLLWVAVVCCLVGSIAIWAFDSPTWLWLLVLLWGVGNFGLLKLVIAVTADLTRSPSPGLLSSMLFGATAGTAMGPWVSSQLVEFGGAKLSLQFGSGAYLLVVLLISSVLIGQRRLLGTQQGTQ